MNNYLNKISYLCFILIASLLGCNIIKREQVYEQSSTPIPINPADTLKPDRKVFLEIFTGFTCGQCPGSTKDGLNELTGSKLDNKTVILKIHHGSFAQPTGLYRINFQTSVGNTLGDIYSILGYPVGIVNRNKYNNSYLVGPGDWNNKVGLVVQKADVDLKIIKVYDTNSKSLKISITSTLYNNFVNKINSIAYLAEDSIIYGQKDYSVEPEYVPNFVHRHVLRDAIQSPTGNDLFAANANKGTKATKEFTPYTLKPEWNAKHCEVIVVITDAVTGEVLQVEKKKVIE